MKYDDRTNMRWQQNAVFSDVLVAMQSAYYQHHTSGGPLHILLDDQNVENEHLSFCRGHASFEGDMAGIAILDMLDQLEPDQREGVIQQVHMGWAQGSVDSRQVAEEACNYMCWRCRSHCPSKGPFKFYDMVTCAVCDVTSPMYNKELFT